MKKVMNFIWVIGFTIFLAFTDTNAVAQVPTGSSNEAMSDNDDNDGDEGKWGLLGLVGLAGLLGLKRRDDDRPRTVVDR